ncbi:hypothetical protein OAL43_03390 [bacterium]|nr:hypothetical protein [Rubripirellula sp.]MDC0279228.1 hypothetical protein [bacterium]
MKLPAIFSPEIRTLSIRVAVWVCGRRLLVAEAAIAREFRRS